MLHNTDVVFVVLCYWRDTPRWGEERRMTEEEKRTAYMEAMKPIVESGTKSNDELFDTYLPVQRFLNSLHPLDAVEILLLLRKDAINKHVKLFFNAMTYRVGDPSGEEARAILAGGLNEAPEDSLPAHKEKEEAEGSLPARKEKAPSRGKKKSVRTHLTAEKETVEEENVEEENVEEIQQPPNPKTTKKRKSKRWRFRRGSRGGTKEAEE